MTTPAPDAVLLERIRYQTGQMLYGSDLTADAQTNAQLRWWHNRSLHNAYGVTMGLAVSRVDTQRRIQVAPGSAYDGFGRELLLPQAQQTDLPAITRQGEQFILVLRYADPRQQAAATEALLCREKAGTVEAALVWTTHAARSLTDGLPLCLWDGAAVTPVWQTYHPLTNRVTRPHVGWGITAQGGTPWKVWTLDQNGTAQETGRQFALGLQTWIDTSAAGFTSAPCYFAWLATPLLSPSAKTTQVIPTHLEGETEAGFWFRLWLPGRDGFARLASSQGSLVDTANARASVGWIGLQEQPGERAFAKAPLDPISFVDLG